MKIPLVLFLICSSYLVPFFNFYISILVVWLGERNCLFFSVSLTHRDAVALWAFILPIEWIKNLHSHFPWLNRLLDGISLAIVAGIEQFMYLRGDQRVYLFLTMIFLHLCNITFACFTKQLFTILFYFQFAGPVFSNTWNPANIVQSAMFKCIKRNRISILGKL